MGMTNDYEVAIEEGATISASVQGSLVPETTAYTEVLLVVKVWNNKTVQQCLYKIGV